MVQRRTQLVGDLTYQNAELDRRRVSDAQRDCDGLPVRLELPLQRDRVRVEVVANPLVELQQQLKRPGDLRAHPDSRCHQSDRAVSASFSGESSRVVPCLAVSPSSR
jgi:hypothetical protein